MTMKGLSERKIMIDLNLPDILNAILGALGLG